MKTVSIRSFSCNLASGETEVTFEIVEPRGAVRVVALTGTLTLSGRFTEAGPDLTDALEAALTQEGLL
ncbi:MAG TPA: hypothetical protein VD978_12140 [Azospirillum sp.]|nr:hypothetical protein [Azospirillum sp.]